MSSATVIQAGRSFSSERYPMRERTPTGSATGSRPKTRTDPLSALSRPMMCLMSVVLPAPFAPTRPYTPPRRKVSVTDDNASFAPNRRVSDEISMTESFKGVQPHPTATRTDTASPRKSAQETVRNADDELQLAHRPTPREISVVRFDAQRGRRVEIKIDAQP